MPYVNIKITREGNVTPRAEQKHRHHGCGYRRS